MKLAFYPYLNIKNNCIIINYHYELSITNY
jgi:hypothetical protein